jgi:hypothetical protein
MKATILFSFVVGCILIACFPPKRSFFPDPPDKNKEFLQCVGDSATDSNCERCYFLVYGEHSDF